MLYVSKVNLQINTARAKHIRSLIAANKNIQNPLEFIFYNFKKPLQNLNLLKKLFFDILIFKKTVYTRDLEYAFIASIFNVKVIYEIHHFGMIRKTTRLFILKRIFLNFLSKKYNVRFVTLTDYCSRVLKCLYPDIENLRINIIPDAGGFLTKSNKKIDFNEGSLNKVSDYKISLSYAGSFMPGKGGVETIMLAQNLQKYKFNLAGNLDDILKNKIKAMRNVNFFGYLNDLEIYNFYQASDILIAPIGERIFLDNKQSNEITFYTSPLKLYEYFCTDKPIITINRPSTRYFINMPGVWIINKEKAYCAKTWEKVISEVFEYLKNTDKKSLLKSRKKYIYNWEKRIRNMIGIK